MSRSCAVLMFASALASAAWLAPKLPYAAELPSILQSGDTFCTNEADFDDFATHGRSRPNSGTETCTRISSPVRVAILRGQGGRKTMIRVVAGPMAYSVGWTNGGLPLAQ